MLGRPAHRRGDGIARREEKAGDGDALPDEPAGVGPEVEHQRRHALGHQPVDYCPKLVGCAFTHPAQDHVADLSLDQQPAAGGRDVNRRAGQVPDHLAIGAMRANDDRDHPAYAAAERIGQPLG